MGTFLLIFLQDTQAFFLGIQMSSSNGYWHKDMVICSHCQVKQYFLVCVSMCDHISMSISCDSPLYEIFNRGPCRFSLGDSMNLI